MGGLLVGAAIASSLWAHALGAPQARRRPPNILILTIDTLRADRLAAYGYTRPTSPAIDRLLASGVRFAEARTVEPLTGPAIASLLTSLDPHEHGATRNGIRIRPRLSSLPKLLSGGGYRTAAFVGNWTLRERLIGLAEHFDTYSEVLNRKRWLGLFKGEATGEDLTSAATDWLAAHQEEPGRRPFLLWVHYVEPHAPYRLHAAFAARLGVATGAAASRSERYDTEVAFVDHQVELLLAAVERLTEGRETLILFAADHGESLGEHGDWGHGRNLREPVLRIPMGLAWAGRVPAGTVIRAPALITDLTPTVLGLLGLPIPSGMRGFDWSAVIDGLTPPPLNRLTAYQAHKGAALGGGEERGPREQGLLEVAILVGGRKEVLRLGGDQHRIFDLARDPGELSPAKGPLSSELRDWLARVRAGLESLTDLPAAELDAESIEKLKALGYID